MAVKTVKASVANREEELSLKSGIRYAGKRAAPSRQLKTSETRSYYPVRVTAEDDSGNITTDETQTLAVYETNVFPGELIHATPEGWELGFLREADLDMDLGDTNDFELIVPLTEEVKENLWYGYQIYMPGTEYGGLIEDVEVVTEENQIYLRGYTWRGLLTQKVVEPPAGKDYLTLSGELNKLLGELIGNRFGSLLVVEDTDTGVNVNNWQVDRYVTLYEAVRKLLESEGYRLEITYRQGQGLEYGTVHLQAVPIVDWSDELEYSQDNRINFRIRDCRDGINHLICLGKGELKDRLVVHLYVQEDGSIGKQPFYAGLAERTATYESTSEEDPAKLEENGREKLLELKNYKTIEMTVDDVDVEIGDIVGGRERITSTCLKKPVVQKILKLSGGRLTVDYKVEGDE